MLGVIFMIAWWWLPIAIVIGAFIGITLMGICAAGKSESGKRWWEDE